MMKKVIILILLNLCLSTSYGQDISIITPSDSVFTKLQAFSKDSFITRNGYFKFSDTKYIYYHSEDAPQFLIDKMHSLSIPLYKSNYLVEEPTKSEVVSENLPNAVVEAQQDYEDLKQRIQEFAQQRDTGYALEVAGYVIISVGAAIGLPAVISVGGVMTLVSVFVKWSASKKLKKIKKSTGISRLNSIHLLSIETV